MCTQMLSWLTRCPCRFCWVSRWGCRDGVTIGAPRTALQNREIAEPAVQTLSRKTKKNKDKMAPAEKREFTKACAAATERLVECSLMPVINGTSRVPFGDDMGVNGATAPDMLHQFALGLICNAVKWTIELIKRAGDYPGWSSGRKRLTEFDR
jgi:hypothetical protein